MDDLHIAASPEYLKGIADERKQTIELIIRLIEASFPEDMRARRSNLIALIKTVR